MQLMPDASRPPLTSADGGVVDGGTLMGPPDGAVLEAIYDRCPDGPHQLEVPIRVNDGANQVVRDPAVTGFLVPIAREEELYSLNSLVVVDSNGARLPAQLEVLGRWGGHREDCAQPIRFAYAHVRAVPPPGEAVAWTVRSSPENGGEESPLTLEESEAHWRIDTGAARFTLRRDRFQGLSRVEVSDGRGGFEVVSELEGDAPGFLIDHGGEKSTASLEPWSYALERRGPQVVTVAARGFYAAPGGSRDLAYTIRLHFTAGSSVARIEHTYYHGAVAGWGANGATNTTRIGRAWMRLPLRAPASQVLVRAESEVATLDGTRRIRLEQEKRSPERTAVRYGLTAGGESVATGAFARRPFLAALAGDHHVLVNVGRMAVREPQALTYDPALSAVEVDFTSSPMQVGGARGIWSVAAVAFGRGAPEPGRADAVQLHAERPLVGAPLPTYLNGTRTIGPYAERTDGPWQTWFALAAEIHARTRSYLEEYRLTGLQLWPDLHRDACHANFNCDEARRGLHEGGDNNYWNWSKPGVDEFFRTGNNDFLYDFSLGEATTYAETLAFRTYHDRIADSSVMGLAACYGDSRGYGGDYREGLNNRRDRCVADYSYSKTLKLAFLATADPRFVDFFEEAGQSVINAFGAPPPNPGEFLEVNLNRLSEQRLEVLTAGAEFGRDPERSALLRQKLRDYVDHMMGRVLIDGHACETGGTGSNDTRSLGYCITAQAWMMPVAIEWATRASRFLGHGELAAWVLRHTDRTAQFHATLDGDGFPNFARAGSDWRTVYRCSADQGGVQDATCRKLSGDENDGRFYPNGLMAYLNLYGLLLAADPTDPHRICAWLPQVYGRQVAALGDVDINYRIWGKSSGQAFAFSAEALGALSRCP